MLRKQERPVIDFNRERCNDAVLSPGVPGQQSDGLDPPHPFGFIRCGIQRARATTDPSLSNLLRLLKSTAKLFLHLEIRKEQLQSFVHSDQIKIIREILLSCKIFIYVYKEKREKESCLKKFTNYSRVSSRFSTCKMEHNRRFLSHVSRGLSEVGHREQE